jgi:hypothetical protein
MKHTSRHTAALTFLVEPCPVIAWRHQQNADVDVRCTVVSLQDDAIARVDLQVKSATVPCHTRCLMECAPQARNLPIFATRKNCSRAEI